MAAKRGRPPSERTKSVLFPIKFYPEVLDALKAAAAAEGQSLAAWLTELGLKRAKRLGITPQEPSVGRS